MITRKNEFLVPGVTVGHILEVRSAEQTRDEDDIKETPAIGQRVLHKPSTQWGIASDRDVTDDYHSGLFRRVPRYQSNFLGTPPDAIDLDMVWNERAISVAIAQELAIVADMLDVGTIVNATKPADLMKCTGLSREFIDTHDFEAISEVVVAIALGSNIVLDDPEELMRYKMNNGNIIGFLGEDGQAGGALIISSYNQPCTNPGKRITEMFPTTVLSPLIKDGFARQVMELLGPYRGWVGGVFAPGHVNVGDKVFVNVAPTTPPLPEEAPTR